MSSIAIDTSVSQKKQIIINPDLVWDYEIPSDAEQNDDFRSWYIARVLTRGRLEDVATIGLKTIYHYFPNLMLPSEIHQFWNWYLNLPEVKERCADTNSLPTTDVNGHRANITYR